ncbi:hypothetical protein BLNAU_8017 [Blattamonas nauphoetae]|uniref:Uncharacterized protein n=1 Tax=Blattamonas nauphoetae TaxID=2049346 RepID=A0ABQ9XZL0_9EUKA|nr:hypothetical protein BLNAU_8017 [Blattamonas nauphoetae]
MLGTFTPPGREYRSAKDEMPTQPEVGVTLASVCVRLRNDCAEKQGEANADEFVSDWLDEKWRWSVECDWIAVRRGSIGERGVDPTLFENGGLSVTTGMCDFPFRTSNESGSRPRFFICFVSMTSSARLRAVEHRGKMDQQFVWKLARHSEDCSVEDVRAFQEISTESRRASAKCLCPLRRVSCEATVSKVRLLEIWLGDVVLDLAYAHHLLPLFPLLFPLSTPSLLSSSNTIELGVEQMQCYVQTPQRLIVFCLNASFAFHVHPQRPARREKSHYVTQQNVRKERKEEGFSHDIRRVMDQMPKLPAWRRNSSLEAIQTTPRPVQSQCEGRGNCDEYCDVFVFTSNEVGCASNHGTSPRDSLSGATGREAIEPPKSCSQQARLDTASKIGTQAEAQRS